jgi:hypothetical protein
MPEPRIVQAVSCDEALRIARTDAERGYGDLSSYRIEVSLEPDGWHLDWELTRPGHQGGGPHYVIDPSDGRILYRRWDQ